MARIVHARLDGESAKLFERLHRLTGWHDSKIIRNGLKALAALTKRSRRIIGLAKFNSGRSDLATNKTYLRGFGRR